MAQDEHSNIAALWAPLRAALIDRDGPEGAAEWLIFAASCIRQGVVYDHRVAAEKEARGIDPALKPT